MCKVLRTLDCGSCPISSAAFSSDRRLFASGSKNGTIRLWRNNETSPQTLNGYHEDEINCVTFSPNNQQLMSASDDFICAGTVKLWNVNNGTEQWRLEGYSDPVTFSPDSITQALHLAGGDVELRGAVNKTLKEPPRVKRKYETLDGWPEVKVLAFSPNGSLLAYGYDNGMLKIREISSDYTRNVPGHEDSIAALAFSNDGGIMASASFGGTIKLRDIHQQRYMFELQGSSVTVHALEFSLDGKLLVSASLDNQIKLWDIARGTLLRQIETIGTIGAILLSSNSICVVVLINQAQGPCRIDICEITI